MTHHKFAAIASACVLIFAAAAPASAKEFLLSDHSPLADGKTDDTAAFKRCFAAAAESGGGTIVIPAGDYFLAGNEPIRLSSRTTVSAYGARFHLPERLGDRARVVLFQGEDVEQLQWFGGRFVGRVFDPADPNYTWEPSVNTRAILITTSPTGASENLTFRDVSSEGLAGAAITVLGRENPGSEREVLKFARNVTIENCTLERSGKFMWDYGYLWQITVWPEEHTEHERTLAKKYFRHDLVRRGLKIDAGDDRVQFSNSPALPLSKPREGAELDRGREAVCFFGDALPAELVRGKQYFVVESTPEFVRVSERPQGTPIRFARGAENVSLIADLFHAHLALYAPIGSGPGKGAFDLVGCENVIVRGSRFSALGDTMHIQKCRTVNFSNNHITGSRMGAFFLAEFCRDAVIAGNTVDGGNGSRVISIEKSCENVVVTGNLFRNGGRGSWINQPKNLVIQGNEFFNNTTKCERDPKRGRKTFTTGDYEKYAEMYFTTHEPNGRYGNVIVRDNIFTSGDHASHAITFAPGGEGLFVSGNVFRGAARTIPEASGCREVSVQNNVGLNESDR